MLFASCKAINISGEHEVQWVKKYRKTSVVKLRGLKREFIFPTTKIKAKDIINLKHKTK